MKALLVIMLIALAGCAHHHKGHGHHHAEKKDHHGKDHKCNCDKKAEIKSAPVEFDGHCAMGLCRKGQKVKCDPEITAAFKGKNYCFSSLEARDTFMKNVDANAKKAHAVWGSSFGGTKN
ncbi:MAG: hypothetical protein ACLGG0_12990 [Bacteriovoracia bacterium]